MVAHDRDFQLHFNWLADLNNDGLDLLQQLMREMHTVDLAERKHVVNNLKFARISPEQYVELFNKYVQR